MSDDNKKEVEISRNHPLEKVFDIEEGTTMFPKTVIQTDVVPYEGYDDKDTELDKQYQNIHDLALTAFEEQSEEAEVVDPKYKARNAEVAVQYLNTALQATNSKAQLKNAKEKLEVSKMRIGADAANTKTQMDRNEILKMFSQQKEGKTYDQDDIEDGEIDESDD